MQLVRKEEVMQCTLPGSWKYLFLSSVLLSSAFVCKANEPSVALIQLLEGRGNANALLILQQGSVNSAVLTQAGQANTGLLMQSGAFNEVQLQQVGQRNNASIRQLGVGNTATLSQLGVGHSLTLEQYGGQSFELTQIGNGIEISIVQY